MKYLMDLYDEEYEFLKFNHIRVTVRCLILNNNNELGYLYIQGHDFFGERNHFESVGGGLEPLENEIDALKREVMEEVGRDIENIKPLGIVVDRYNLLKRINVHKYYIVNLGNEKKLQRTEVEAILIQDFVFKSSLEWLEIFKKGKSKVDRLVHKREFTVLNHYLNQYNK